MNWWDKLWASAPNLEYGERPSAFRKQALEAAEYEERLKRDSERADASQKAFSDFLTRANEELDSYKPTGAAFKIIQRPAGHFEIERRSVVRASGDLYTSFWSGGLGTGWEGPTYAHADTIKEWSVAPREVYDVVINDNAPIKTIENSYARWGRETREVLKGYQPLAFNIFADAEAYLFRMTQPSEVTTEYDFPPLKKRVSRKPKGAPK